MNAPPKPKKKPLIYCQCGHANLAHRGPMPGSGSCRACDCPNFAAKGTER